MLHFRVSGYRLCPVGQIIFSGRFMYVYIFARDLRVFGLGLAAV